MRWLPLLLVACKRPSHDECAQVIGRYVDMRAGDDVAIARAPEASRPALREASAAAKRRSAEFSLRVAQCEREVDRAQLECGRTAPGPNEWEACFQ